jgi:hypothetical protein
MCRAEREASGLGSWVGAYLRSESDARRLLISCEDLEADNQRWEQDCRGFDAENKSLRAEKQDLLRRLGLLETSRSMEYTAISPSVPRTIEPNSRALPTRRPPNAAPSQRVPGVSGVVESVLALSMIPVEFDL